MPDADVLVVGAGVNFGRRRRGQAGFKRRVVPVFCGRQPSDQGPPLVLHDSGSTLAGGGGPINNVSLSSNVSPNYAPPGCRLVSALLIAARPSGMDRATWHQQLDVEGRLRLRRWFGVQVDGWTTRPTYEIAHAQPAQPSHEPVERPVKVAEGLYGCGDHRDQPSIQGAHVSGRCAAAAMLDGAPVYPDVSCALTRSAGWHKFSARIPAPHALIVRLDTRARGQRCISTILSIVPYSRP